MAFSAQVGGGGMSFALISTGTYNLELEFDILSDPITRLCTENYE